MHVRREARILKNKALSSLRRAAESFNSFDEQGRSTAVLLHAQHAFEMLLKAGLVQRRVAVFDEERGMSIGFDRCVNLSREYLKITDEEAGLLRAVDALRDQEQHWIVHLSEGLLYAHARAAVTLFDELLQRTFGESLTTHLPIRVLPLSAEPPRDIQLLLDDEYSQIHKLLERGRRQNAEAKVRIRSLLALEAHVATEVIVSNRDVDRVAVAIRAGRPRTEVIPRLTELASDISGDGLHVKVHFSKKDGAPVRYIAADDPTAAAAVREVDFQKKYHINRSELARLLGLSEPRALALRRKLRIDESDRYCHDFIFGKSVHRMYSDVAVVEMRKAMASVNMEEVWQEHRPGGKRK